jgi:diadenosine tetraphosphate (Ap4A) HIT family hydrolase
MKNGLWSFHDLPELALEAMNRIAKLEDCIRELLKGADGFNAVVKKEEAARKLLG